MANPDVEKKSLGDKLLERGWQQGALFSAPPSISFVYHKRFQKDSEIATTIVQRNVKGKERLVIISQDCDIKSDKEPYIEALICKPEKDSFVEKVGQLSSRWFVVDTDKRLVAEAKYRIQIEKEVFLDVDPISWPSGPNRLDAFVRWLARRYDRPAFPDEMVEVFQKPVESKLKELESKDPEAFSVFNGVVHDIRVSLPTSEDPPFDLHMLFLINDNGLTVQEADAIETVKKHILGCLNPMLVHLDPQISLLTEEEISMAEYYASRPMYFDYYTYNGDEIDGAEPHARM